MNIERGTLKDENGSKFKRLRLKRENAAAVLIFNSDTNKIVLTKQFRYAISSEAKENILEIVAGKTGNEEDTLNTAIRETEEETGYRIHPEKTQLLYSCFSSPGYSSERFFIYYTEVKNEDKISQGGGLKEEHEFIEIVETDINEFRQMFLAGNIMDAKTYIAAFHFFQIRNK
ncbi:MAG: NUDIX hydrolase [Deltaproteobacteria bacterium]|nr:NUDIX hydrolase [Deltaproteobacteria bacterium]